MSKTTSERAARIPALLGSALLVLTGCALFSPPPPSHGSPGETFRAFVREMERENFSSAYRYFSRDTKKRYKLNHFHGLMNRTRAGKLLQWKIKHWTIKSVEQNAPDRAVVIMASPSDPEKTNQYELVRETTEEGKRFWRIRFYLADELGIPRVDEEQIFQGSSSND